MEIAIAVLLSVVITTGISLYFYNLMKANNSMEKVRRYADKRSSDLEGLYKAVEDKFKLLITEFNSHQTQANAAVKLLKQQNDDFNSKMIFLIQIKFLSMNDLNDMTEKVEENLMRIQNESTIVDKLTDRLNRQDQLVDSIEKKVPQITENFSKHNADQLKAIGTTLLDQYKNYAANLAYKRFEKHKRNI